MNIKRLPTSRDTVAMSIVPTGSDLVDLVAIAFLTPPPFSIA
ncbi:MAG TPA: hypothetical protein VFR41_14070 [Acidimicrobiia bacterium]|nr:hypothetical protein [Acidimicrobiia bacterium]